MLYKSYLIENDIELLNKENSFLFFGENYGLKNEIKDKIKYNNIHSEIILINQEELLKNNNFLYNEIQNISLFEKNKIFLIDQVNDKILDTIKEATQLIDKQKVYLFADLLDKKSKIRNYFEKTDHCGAVACYADNEMSIKKILISKLKGFQGLSPHNINLIIENSNLNRVKLNNELTKIITFFQDKIIKTEKLEILLDIKVNDDFNSLKDEALKGDKLKTNKLLSDTLMDAEKTILYISLINQRLNKLYEVQTLSEKTNIDDAISKLRPPIFWKDKPNFIIQNKKWNTKKIESSLKKTFDFEVKIKSNSILNKNVLMKKLIIDLCELANV
ncbi:hypothetical protein OAR56_00615 [Pelagibacteraceae bacterium]|nr:hypothetical protein [Pelagibacteraceae bacterium]